MPRLLVLLTGGTLMMSAELRTEHGPTAKDLIREIPSLERLAELETKLLWSMDSANMQPADWLALAREVHGALPSYDGIVVVHGTDTMAYTASALALLLGPLPKPVVLTGSQKPLVDARTDARQNLIAAILVATLGVPEVSIVFGSQALRGVRATKRDAWGFDAFDSPHVAPLVDLGIDVEVAPHVLPRADLAPFDDRLEPRVLAVRIFPGLDPTFIQAAVQSGVRGLVLEGYGTGNVPRSLLPALEEAQAKDVPVVVVSQCLRGFVDLSRYEGGAMAAAAGAISAKDMTVEAAVAKLMIGMGRFGTGPELRSWFATSVAGERDT